jgi:AcrR family transcriptional regulator
MARIAATKKRPHKRGTVRPGRPPRERTGEVEARILNAARRVFLQRGLAGASMEEIAGLARSGKPTIYARFASKEDLFAAVMMRNVDSKIARFEGHAPTGATIEDRLANLGITILHWALLSDTVGLMRLGIAEARRFPDLASTVHQMLRERGTGAVARLLGQVAQSDELGTLPAFAPRRITTTTRFFLDLVLLPLLLRALFGEKLKPLHKEIDPHVARSVAFFLAASRHSGVS